MKKLSLIILFVIIPYHSFCQTYFSFTKCHIITGVNGNILILTALLMEDICLMEHMTNLSSMLMTNIQANT